MIQIDYVITAHIYFSYTNPLEECLSRFRALKSTASERRRQ